MQMEYIKHKCTDPSPFQQLNSHLVRFYHHDTYHQTIQPSSAKWRSGSSSN